MKYLYYEQYFWSKGGSQLPTLAVYLIYSILCLASVDVLYEKTRRPAHLSPQHNPSLQGLHSGRRVNFGREQFHEFSMENNCTAVTPKTDVTAQQVFKLFTLSVT